MTGTWSYGLVRSLVQNMTSASTRSFSPSHPPSSKTCSPSPNRSTRPWTNERHGLPVVDIPEAPEAIDAILRFIYPGVELPKIEKPSTLSALLCTADKYDIRSIYPFLSESLKASLLPPNDSPSLWAYITACRFGFSDVAKAAAKRSCKDDLSYLNNLVDIQHVSSTDLYRLVQFVLTRERDGFIIIRNTLNPSLLEDYKCPHNGKEAQDYYCRLQRAVEEAFVGDPCVGAKDLSEVLDRIPDPPFGCDPPPESADWYSEASDYDPFECPLRPMTIRRGLWHIANDLDIVNDRLMGQFFGKDVGSGRSTEETPIS